MSYLIPILFGIGIFSFYGFMIYRVLHKTELDLWFKYKLTWNHKW